MPRRSHPSRPAAGSRGSRPRGGGQVSGEQAEGGGLGWTAGWQQRASTPDGEFLVRTVPGAAARKPYRCPGCQQLIAPGVGHVVSWPVWAAEDDGGVAERRHWHTACWHRRASRGGPGLIA